MGEKNRAIVAARVSADQRERLAERMGSVHISRIREMPRIELYLDQLLTLVSQELEFMQLPGETLVTGSMVNNYVKQGVIPAPRKKRYTRRHVASLLFVCALKRVFSIAQVSQLAALIWASELDLEALYDSSCAALEGALARRFSLGEKDGEPAAGITLVDRDGNPADPELAWLLQAATEALADKVAVEQALLLASEEATGR